MPISLDAAVRTKGERRGRLSIRLMHELPVGQGFGMSAAGALATARAAAAAIGSGTRPPSEIAHLADLSGHGGLGGVAAIGGGGLEIRQRAGVPPWGKVRRIRFPYRVFVATVGRPMPSSALLGDSEFLARVEAAAAEGLATLRKRSTADTFLEAAETFTDRLELGPASLTRRIPVLRRSGARVAQAMFGRALFAVPPDARTRDRLLRALVRERLSAVEVAVLPPSSETL
jgi:pantoate kinase